jgi:hypothetical protein
MQANQINVSGAVALFFIYQGLTHLIIEKKNSWTPVSSIGVDDVAVHATCRCDSGWE